jgi:hypothetical protein
MISYRPGDEMIDLIGGPVVIIRISEHGANRLREAVREQVRQASGGPFEDDWQELLDLVSQEMSLCQDRRSRYRAA